MKQGSDNKWMFMWLRNRGKFFETSQVYTEKIVYIALINFYAIIFLFLELNSLSCGDWKSYNDQ